jgi:hypothetical protein
MKMKAVALACVVAASRVSAQSDMFTYTDVPAGPIMPIEEPPPGVLLSVESRKVHGASAFNINLPGVECRSGGVTNDYEVVFTFLSVVNYTGVALAGTGSVINPGGGKGVAVHVYLTGITNTQRITVTLQGVSGTGDRSATMGVLVGDTNGDGLVNAGDALQTRNRSGQASDATNFRSDVNADGIVNSGDTTIVRSRSGTSLP